jgi:antitoxin (DNA-binding transcriptional repressor) of toxin-antitoxin stability system
MAVMSASEVSRNFSAVVDRAAAGEHIEIIRNGKLVAELGPPTARPNGRALLEALSRLPRAGEGDDWYEDVLATRELLTEGGDPWSE